MLEKVTVGFLGRRLLTDTSPVCSNFPKFFHYIPSLLELDICGTTLEYPVGDIVEPAVQLLRAQSSPYGVVKLQRVRVNMFTSLEMEMEFMKFILPSAPVLGEIFIWNCTRFLFRSCKEMIDEMKEFRRASPNVEFTFEEIDMEGGSYEHEEVMGVP
uniref:Ubiquitin-protein ligase n=1 Tax=Solanum tuberosum TaxID=4113 RepID=M1BA50_SOLTU